MENNTTQKRRTKKKSKLPLLVIAIVIIIAIVGVVIVINNNPNKAELKKRVGGAATSSMQANNEPLTQEEIKEYTSSIEKNAGESKDGETVQLMLLGIIDYNVRCDAKDAKTFVYLSEGLIDSFGEVPGYNFSDGANSRSEIAYICDRIEKGKRYDVKVEKGENDTIKSVTVSFS